MTLTLTQALQLAGLIPCLFLVLMFLALSPRNAQTFIPALYFAALACSFAWPLLEVYDPLAHNFWLEFGFGVGKSTLVSFSFLLICQFMLGRVPPPAYWLVLAIPLIGGSSLVYANLMHVNDVCGGKDVCTRDITVMRALYNIVSSAFVFLLLVYYSSRAEALHSSDIHRRHKYWLIIVLIMLNLLILATSLAEISGHLTQDDTSFANTIFRLGFIYFVLTSLFRVFYPALGHQPVQLMPKPSYQPEVDLPHVEKIKALLEGDGIFREMRLNRAALANKIGIGEHHLSRLINHHFGKNFNELINSYRIDEAKQRLKNEPEQQITVIAFETGFNSIASFNRVFKSKVGVSPTEYRIQAAPEAASIAG